MITRETNVTPEMLDAGFAALTDGYGSWMGTAFAEWVEANTSGREDKRQPILDALARVYAAMHGAS